MPQYEMIDIVDEHDNVVKTIERTPEWNATRPDPYRVVNVLVFNSEGKLLVQQRSRHKSAGPLLFDTSVGGVVTASMTYDETAKKEMEEELGIEANLTFVTKFKDYRKGNFFSMNGLYIAVNDGPYSNWEREAERLEFMEVDEAKKLMDRFPYFFTPAFIRALDEYIKAQI